MTQKLQTTLTRRERQIMDILYRRGRATGVEVMDELPGTPSYSTVRTQLRVLEKKGHVRHEEQGLKFIYLPAVPRRSARKSALRHLVDTFFDGSVEKVVGALLGGEGARVSEEELERIAEPGGKGQNTASRENPDDLSSWQHPEGLARHPGRPRRGGLAAQSIGGGAALGRSPRRCCARWRCRRWSWSCRRGDCRSASVAAAAGVPARVPAAEAPVLRRATPAHPSSSPRPCACVRVAGRGPVSRVSSRRRGSSAPASAFSFWPWA